MNRTIPKHSIFVMLLTLVMTMMGCGQDAKWTGKAAPDVTFKTLKGQQLNLQSMDKPVLVSFWSTSCSVCIKEMPDLAELYNDYAPRGFEMVAVALPSDRPDQVLKMAEDKALPYPVAIDISGDVVESFEPVRATPTTYLISASGTVLNRHVGPVDIQALRTTLDELLS